VSPATASAFQQLEAATRRGQDPSWFSKPIAEAIAEEKFELYRQPVVSLASGALSHYELLLRLRRRSGQVIPPRRFMPVARTLGLMGDIDRWVVTRAAALLTPAGEPGRPQLELNLSRSSIDDDTFTEFLRTQLSGVGARPEALIVELAGEEMVEAREVHDFARRLSELGCRFALDDFGRAGYSTFSALKSLPFHYIKIGGEFVRNLPTSEIDREIVHSTARIATLLRREVVAVGVPDDETVELLYEMGVSYGQGFHFGTPEPVAGDA
jgi:EAL domain-containing protein (putative c-di-GMP-specific phosphodiesterase class I)